MNYVPVGGGSVKCMHLTFRSVSVFKTSIKLDRGKNKFCKN